MKFLAAVRTRILINIFSFINKNKIGLDSLSCLNKCKIYINYFYEIIKINI